MGIKVLIVDDEPDVAAYLAAALRAHGHLPTVAHSAAEGLESIRRARPDIISLDIVMPRESGVSMYVRLRRNDEHRSIPLLIVSGVGQDGRLDFRNYVADESVPPPDRYLEKPIKVDEFIKTVEELAAASGALEGRAGK